MMTQPFPLRTKHKSHSDGSSSLSAYPQANVSYTQDDYTIHYSQTGMPVEHQHSYTDDDAVSATGNDE